MSKEKSTSNFVLRFKNVRKPLLVLILGLLLTFYGTFRFHQNIEAQAKRDYLINCDEIKIEILTRMHSQAQIIRVASAFIESSDTTTSHDWKAFYQQSLVSKELPGIRSFGYAAVISKAQQKENIQANLKDVCPANTVLSPEERDFHTSCIFIEPFIDANSRFLGYDMYARPIRRKAMEMARDSDMVALSGKVILEHEDTLAKEASTLMYVPVFRNGSPTNTVEQRRKAIKGWVFSAYHMDDLMHGILEHKDSMAHIKINLQIFDDSISSQSLLYDSQIKEKNASTNNSDQSVSIPVLIGGKKWILNFTQSTGPGFHYQRMELIRIIGLLMINFLLFFLLLSLQNTGLRAQKIAEKLTKELSLANKELAGQSEVVRETANLLALKNEELLKSEEHYRSMIESSLYPIVIVGDGKIFYANPSANLLFGATSEKGLIGTNMADRVHPDFQQLVTARIKKCIEDQSIAPKTEMKYLKLDGSVLDVEVQSSPINYGGVQSIQTAIHDITERKQNQNLLQESHSRFSSMITNISDVISIIGADGLIKYRSPNSEKFFGWLPEERIGTNSFSIVHPDDQEMAQKVFQRLMEKENSDLTFEFRYLCKDGSYKPVEMTACNLINDPVIEGILLNFHDISERKKSDEEKTRQAVLINLLLDSIPDIIFFKDLKGVYVGCNPAFTELIGLSKNEIIGKTDYDFFDQENADWFTQHDQEMLKTKHTRNNEEWVTYPDGSKVLLDTLKTPYCDTDGTVIGILGISRDITARKQAEETIVKLSKGVEQSSASIIITDEHGIIEFANPKYCQLTGYSMEEVIGRNPKITQSSTTPIETYEKLWETILAGEEWRGELLNKKKNGDLYWEFMTISQIKNTKGEITNFIAVKEDITERKNAEEELRSISARLALATRTGGVGLWEYDLANNSLLWDDQMFALYGTREGDFSGIYQAWRAGLHPEDIDRCDRETQMAIRGEKEFDTEFRVVWPDGSIHTIKALASVQLDESGRSVRMIGTNWDISEQKRTELEIKLQNEELQKINSEKDKFFSIIAHDLRGPLGNFMGMTEMLTDETYDFPEKDRKEMIEGLSRSARNTFTLLVNLLEWSQMDRGLTEFKPQKLDLTQTIAECTGILEDSAKLKRIELIVQITNEPVVFADKNMLQTVIRNLISNAIKFTPKGGKVSVSAELSANNMALISVRDTGIGMTSEMLNNLFRIDASTKRPGTSGELSTGLGLLLCKEFVEKLNGTITVESEPNIGTVFSFNIPAMIQEKKELAKQISVSEEIHEGKIENLNILIAEDDEISMKLISVIVAGFSKQVFKVKTGDEAVKVSRENQDIDVILMDIAMPNMNGYEATRQIREYNKDVVIIAQTTYALANDKENALLAGCNDNITKPFSKDDIITILKKHIKPSI